MEVCRYTASIWSYVPSLENEKKTSNNKKNTPKIPVNIAVSHKKGRDYLTYSYTLITSMAYIRFWYPHYCQKPDYKNLIAKMRRKEKSIKPLCIHLLLQRVWSPLLLSKLEQIINLSPANASFIRGDNHTVKYWHDAKKQIIWNTLLTWYGKVEDSKSLKCLNLTFYVINS